MNQETLAVCRAVGASIYEPFAKCDAKTIEALNKMCNPLAGIINPSISIFIFTPRI